MQIVVAMIVLLAASIAALPTWPYSARWGYVGTGACGLIVAGMAVLVLVGRL